MQSGGWRILGASLVGGLVGTGLSSLVLVASVIYRWKWQTEHIALSWDDVCHVTAFVEADRGFRLICRSIDAAGCFAGGALAAALSGRAELRSGALSSSLRVVLGALSWVGGSGIVPFGHQLGSFVIPLPLSRDAWGVMTVLSPMLGLLGGFVVRIRSRGSTRRPRYVGDGAGDGAAVGSEWR